MKARNLPASPARSMALALALALAGPAAAKQAPAGKPPKRPPHSLSTEQGPAVPPSALVGWAVIDAATGAPLEDRNPRQNFVPGSTQKLFTTWLALETLGPDKTLSTGLYHTGKVDHGVLEGDLWIKGGGDPGFAGLSMGPLHARDAVFQAWAAAVAKLGVRKVEGCVSGDGSFLAEEGPHPASLWEDVGNYYAGNVSGLCFNDNLYELGFDGHALAGKAVILKAARPRRNGIQAFENGLMTSAPGGRDSAYILGGFPSPIRLLRGTYPAGRTPFTIKGSLPNPAWTAAQELRDYLSGHGLQFVKPAGRPVDGSACGDSLALPNRPAPDYGKARLIASHASAPVRELVRHTNQKSDNNYAAQLLALAGKHAGREGSWRGGLEAMQAWLDRQGFDRGQYHFRDGTGLSRYNWVSPSQLVKLLQKARAHPQGEVFRASLVGGAGSERKLDRHGPGWAGRLYVKTGTLEGVASLAGYLRADSGKWIAFAVMANNYDSRHGMNPGTRADPQAAFIPLLQRWARQY